MYSIFAGNVRIYSDTTMSEDELLINPKLSLEDSAAGSLTMTVPVGNKGYNVIERMKTDITVVKNGEEIWWGRVLSEEQDFDNNRILTCEGALAFLNDVVQPQNQMIDTPLLTFFTYLINTYNSRAAANRQFSVGAVTAGSLVRRNFNINYEKTIECINKLVTEFGGHLRVRKSGGVYILDLLDDYPSVNTQVINFGVNLLDFTRKWSADEFASVVIPLGERLEESHFADIDERLTVAEVNSGSIYVESQAVATYGRIEKVVTFDGCTDPSELLRMGQDYLASIQFDTMELELSAIDLNYLDINYESIKLLDKIRAISAPHGMNHLFPVRRMTIPMDSPENATFTLGDTQRFTLTSVNNQINQELLDKIKNTPSKSTMLDAAKANATEIMNMATNGFVTIHQDQDGTDAIYISSERDYTQSQKLWKWNVNGLAYSNDYGQTWGLAMTMDGAIVADFITAGTLNGDLVQAGTITAEKISSLYRDAVSGAISRLSQDIDGLTLSYSEGLGGKSGTLSLNRNGVQIDSENITMTGAVTFNDLSGSGSSVINGDNITTGSLRGRSIYLDRIDDNNPGSEIYFTYNDWPYGSLRFDQYGAGTDYETQNRITLRTLDVNVALKLESTGGMSMVGDKIFENGKNYITLQSGGYYNQSGTLYTWVPGQISIGNANTYQMSQSQQCRVDIWGDLYLNNQRITGGNTAVFG